MTINPYFAPASPDRVRRLKVKTHEFLAGDMHEIVVPPWGYLEALELRMEELVPNMDASMPYRLRVAVAAGMWPPLPMSVYAIVRDVLSHGESRDPLLETDERYGRCSILCPNCEEPLVLDTTALLRRAE